MITKTAPPYDSPGTLVFWHQQSLVGDAPFSLKFALKVIHPSTLFEYNDVDQYPLIAPQPWELAKNVQLTLGSRPREFQRAIEEPCTLPLSLSNGGTKRDFAGLLVKFNFYRKKSAAKFLCVKTSRGRVVATSLLCLTVHRRDCGWRHHLRNICAQSDSPLQKTQISTNFA